MHDIDVVTPLEGQHDLQVGVVLTQPGVRHHRHVGTGRVAEAQRRDVELGRPERGVAAGTGEEGHLDAAAAKAADEMPRQGLQATGKRFGDRVLGGSQDYDVHDAPRSATAASTAAYTCSWTRAISWRSRRRSSGSARHDGRSR